MRAGVLRGLRLGFGLVLGVVLALIVVRALLPRVVPFVDCTVGVTNTQATVTVQGVGAARACNDLVAGHDNRAPAEPTTLPIVCTVHRAGLTYTVRDTGLLVIEGRTLCAELGQ